MASSTRLSPRADATRRRREEILDAALECFSTIGYDQTTLADIREKAGASTGSIYHHFGSKEKIAASLYLDAVRQTQEAGLQAVLRTRTARTGIAAQVAAYIDWVVEHPALARFLFAMRHAPFLDTEESTITALNTDMQDRAARWISERVDAGELPDIEPAMRWAIVFGPCRHWAGSWLRSQRILGAVNPVSAGLATIWMSFLRPPARSSISAHSAEVRWSFQSNARRTTWFFLSRKTEPCI